MLREAQDSSGARDVRAQLHDLPRAFQLGLEFRACPGVHPSATAAGSGGSQLGLPACLALSPLMAIALCFQNTSLED